MGKAAALCRGSGCGGRSRGLSSLFTVVPCLSCHTAAPSMNAPTPGSGPEPKPQLQPVPQPQRELVSEQVLEPVSERAPGSEPEPKKMSEPRPGFRQELELLPALGTGSGPREEWGSNPGPGPPTKAPFEQVPALGPAVGSVPLIKPESGLLPASKDPRPGQVKTHLGMAVPRSSSPGVVPMVSLPLDNFKGWLLKWTNYLKGYQRRWFVLSNGLLSYYRYGGVRVEAEFEGWRSCHHSDGGHPGLEGVTTGPGCLGTGSLAGEVTPLANLQLRQGSPLWTRPLESLGLPSEQGGWSEGVIWGLGTPLALVAVGPGAAIQSRNPPHP